MRATHYFRCFDWRDGLGLLSLLLLFTFGCTHWFAYVLFCVMFLFLRQKIKPACTTATFDTFPMGVLLFDHAARCCYANQKWQACSGATLQALLGDGWLATIHPEDKNRVLALQKAMQSGGVLNVEYRLLRPDGQISWVSSVILPMHDFSDVSFQLLLVDLNELKQQENQMATLLAEQKQIKEELESILSSSNDPIAAMDMKFNFTVFNQGYAALFYDLYHIHMAKKDCFLKYELNSVDDRSNLITSWGRVLQGESFVVRSALQGQGNQTRIFDLSFSPQFNSAGEQIGAVNVLHDVTLSAQTELALSRSEELFKVATQSSLDAIYVLEVMKDKGWNIIDFLIVEVNPNGFDFLNLHENEIPNNFLSRKLKEIKSDHFYDLCCEVFASKKSFIGEEENINPYYEGAWLQIQIVAVSTGVVFTISDISQRKKTALAMATFSSLQQAILDSAGSAIIVTDLNHTIRLFNRSAELMLGYQAGELIAQETPAIFHQSKCALPLVAEFMASLGAEINPDLDIFSLQAMRFIQSDWIYQHRDGHVFPVELTMNVVRDQQGEITGYMGIANDISVRKQAEIKLQQSEYRISAILDSLHDCILSMGFDGVIRDANPAALRVFAYDDLVGEPLSILFPLLGNIDSKRGVAKELSERLGVDTGQVSEVLAINKAGNEVAMDMALTVVEVDGERVYIATLHDLTQHKIDEEKMQETIEELEAVQASLSVNHEQLTLANLELSRLAHMDGLTGLANRRLFDQTLMQEWARAARDGKTLALVMLDVDFFKRYNDHFGHQAGDECLKRVATAMVAALHRPGDFVARYGGEEFVLILPSTDQQGAVLVVEEVLHQVRNLAIVHQTSDAAKVVTLSAGIAVLPPLLGVDPYCLVEAADQALYQAKHLGRNRYFVAGSNRLT